MRTTNRSIQALLAAGLVISMLPVGLALAKGASAEREQAKAELKASTDSVLGDLHSFDVHGMEQLDFSSERQAVPPEIIEYARTALQTDDRLRYQSPGQAVLHFSCQSPQCGMVKAEVTIGEDGPVVWSTVQRYRAMVSLGDPDPRKFAQKVVERLGADYQKSMKAVPLKINIKED